MMPEAISVRPFAMRDSSPLSGERTCGNVSFGIQYGHGRNPPDRSIRKLVCQLRDRKLVPALTCASAGCRWAISGDVGPVGEGVSELRIDYGPGYRVYFIQRGAALVILLAGGDKSTQDQDIRTALKFARVYRW